MFVIKSKVEVNKTLASDHFFHSRFGAMRENGEVTKKIKFSVLILFLIFNVGLGIFDANSFVSRCFLSSFLCNMELRC